MSATAILDAPLVKAWPQAKLADVADIVNGGTPKSNVAEFWDGEHQWLTPADMGKMVDREITQTPRTITAMGLAKSSARLAPPKSVILSTRAPIGHLAINVVPMAFNQGCRALVPGPKLDHVFLYYFLLHSRELLNELGTGTTFKELSATSLKTVQMPLPPLEEQKRIVALLDQAFVALDRARALAEANLADAMALPQAAVDEIFLSAPASWEHRTLGDVCKFVGGSQPPKTVFEYSLRPGLVRLIQIRDYKTDQKAVYVPSHLAKRFCRADDVMIGRYGPPLFQILRGLEGAYNVALMKAVPNETKISKDFLFYFLKNSEILRYIIDSSSRAAGQAGINKSTIEPYPIAYPTLDEQATIVERVHSVVTASQRAVMCCREKLEDLTELRQSILQKAFAGELT